MGVPGNYPPLAKSEWVNGSPKRLAMILLKGLQGPVTVAGQSFPGTQAMPAWGTNLNNKKLSQVMTYIRSEWGNSAPEVTETQVAAARKEFESRSESWTINDIQAVPADAQLEGGPAPEKK
jgi:mono/diheme cytochrome c family protein